jgi:hypothetical protein
MKALMNNTFNSAASMQGFVFSYLGFVLDASTITAAAAMASALIGFLMMLRAYQKTSIIDLETEKAGLEVQLLKIEILEKTEDGNIRKN